MEKILKLPWNYTRCPSVFTRGNFKTYPKPLQSDKLKHVSRIIASAILVEAILCVKEE